VIALLLGAVLTLAAQGPPPAPPQPPSPAGAPARDAAPPPKGHAVIKGQVIRADTKQPLRRAVVRISGAPLTQSIVASTNPRGVYEVRDLPPGRYTVSVTRIGYLPFQHGQRYPGEAGTPLEVRGEGTIEIDFALSRAGTISGRVTDETGDIVAGAAVWLLQPRFFEGRRRLVPVSPRTTQTDEGGEYSLTGIPPGEYVLMAVFHETWTTRAPEPLSLGYVPSYYPGTDSPLEAQRVRVGVAQDVGAIDIALVPGRTAAVSGSALWIDGTPLGGASVILSYRIAGPSGMDAISITSGRTIASTRAAADGSFALRDVPPGEYEILMNYSDPDLGTYSATVPVAVAGADVSGLVVTPAAPAMISGAVVTDDVSPLPGGGWVRALRHDVGPAGMAVPAQLGAKGTFTLTRVAPGRTVLAVTSLPPGWGVRSITIGGREHVDTPIEVPGGAHIDHAQIVLSRTLPVVAGRAVDEDGEAVQATVLLFPVDPAKWIEGTGTLHTARPDQDGRFRLLAVRPGEYFAAALDYVQTWQATDPEFLESVRRHATKVQVVEGDNEPLTLRVVR
jgi:hypothetical protein